MALAPTSATVYTRASIRRPECFLFAAPEIVSAFDEWSGCREAAWQSNGGPFRGHVARSFPYSFEAEIPQEFGPLERIHLVGVFALFGSSEFESPGTIGASVHVLDGRDVVFRQDLINGRHYGDAFDLERSLSSLGDGSSISNVGVTCVDEVACRVDVLSIDVPPNTDAQVMRFKDLGSPASFVIFDVFFETKPEKGCPFHSRTGGVSLAELASCVRLGDRVKFSRALRQLEHAVSLAEDLDEARGQALTFLAVITAGMLERGGSRNLHRLQLDAARALDRVNDREAVLEVTLALVDEVSAPLFGPTDSASAQLIDRALALVERNYAKRLNDSTVANQLGLSTSHFRFLFRQATGQPFHKYLIALRLEKAKQMLQEQSLPVGAVAEAVGFTGLSHFSRAFAHRFQVSPTNVRKNIAS